MKRGGGIRYNYFIVPDKSIVCKDLLPFKWNNIKRNIDNIPEIPDFSERFNPNHFFHHDTHMNFIGGKLFVFCLINYLDSSFLIQDYERLIRENSKKILVDPGNDLLTDINWSYTDEERNNISVNKCTAFISKNLINITENIPERFKYCRKRENSYLFNPSSYTSLRVLIFHDSTIHTLKVFLSLYFKEMFLCWDHGTLDEDLIKWFNPDIILEIRVERFLERIMSPNWVKLRKNIFEE